MYMKGDTPVSCMGYDYMANFDLLEPNDLFQKGKPLPAFKHKIAKYEVREGKKGRLEVFFAIDQYIPRLDKSLLFDFKLTVYPDGKVEISQGEAKSQPNKYSGTLQM